jgi:hypothetical protein
LLGGLAVLALGCAHTRKTPSPNSPAYSGSDRATPTPIVVEEGKLPFLQPIPGQPGYFYEPGEKDTSKRIDARGMPPGDIVVSPYSRKIYRLPLAPATPGPKVP